MRYLRNLVLIILCMLTISCSSAAEKDFGKIVTRVNDYFSGKPVLLISDRIIKGGQESYNYYCILIKNYNLTYGVKKSFSKTNPYNAFLVTSCDLLDNAGSGDSVSKIYEFGMSEGVIPNKTSGFSTTSLALANQNFSNRSKTMTIIIRYSYQENKWSYDDMSISGLESARSLINDLTYFPQNKAFRDAIEMSN